MTEKPQTERPPLAVVILAAGLGTRMKSDAPKVLHEVCGRPMLSYVIDAALSVSPERIVVVTGPDQEAIAEIMPVGCERAVQQERRGTGDAVRAGLEPLVGLRRRRHGALRRRAAGARRLRRRPLPAAPRRRRRAPRSPRSRLDDPAHYGRIVRDERDGVARIVEYRDATPDEREIDEINVGLYVFAATPCAPALARLGSDNAQGELYLTDVVHLLIDAEHVVATYESRRRGDVHGRQLARRARDRQRRHAPAPARAPDARRRHGRRPGHHLRRLGRRGGPRHR